MKQVYGVNTRRCWTNDRQINAKLGLVLAVLLLLCSCTKSIGSSAVGDIGAQEEVLFSQQDMGDSDEASAQADADQSLQTIQVDPDVERYNAIINHYRNFVRYDGDDVDGNLVDTFYRIADEAGISGKIYDNGREGELANSLGAMLSANAGYGIADLNGDGIPELIILSEEDYFIYAIYTLSNDQPVLVGGYWNRHRCAIDEAMTVYVHASSGAADHYSAAYFLAPNDTELQLIEMVGVETVEVETDKSPLVPRYYWIRDGHKTVIGEDEAGFAWERFPDVYPGDRNPTKNIGLVFVSLME